jgi:hypothetical protein
LVQQGYQVHLRETVGGGVGGQCLRNLHHSFLCCSAGKLSAMAVEFRANQSG